MPSFQSVSDWSFDDMFCWPRSCILSGEILPSDATLGHEMATPFRTAGYAGNEQMALICSIFTEKIDFRRSLSSALIIPVLLLNILGCEPGPTGGPIPWLVDRSKETGLEFTHNNGMSGERYFCEIVGPGVAIFDYDGDGDMDVALNQGHLLKKESTQNPIPSLPMPEGHPKGLRLFRNEGVKNKVPVFTDVTNETGIDSKVYGMGLAVSDVNNDGTPDLLVTGFGEDELWVSTPSGIYENLASEWGVADPRWTTSAIFADVDRDGDEDLYVCAYVDFSLSNHKPCYGSTSLVDYCGPNSYPSLTDRFYVNDGHGGFVDWTVNSGIGSVAGAGLGVACSDLDNDGDLDFYVANDGEANRLWSQSESLRFTDSALLNGCALNRNGKPEASMGAEIADFDGDGDEDVFLTHLDGETNTLYRNEGEGFFDDISTESGLGIPSRKWTGFGTAWVDFDNDGWLDLYVTNGAVKMAVDRLAKGEVHPLGQPDQLYRNLQGESFIVFSEVDVPALAKETVGRGAAWGDLDDDGDLDLVVTGNGESARLLFNTIGQDSSWIGLSPLDSKNRFVAGVKFEINIPESKKMVRYSRRGGSYLSSHDPRVVIGLAGNNKPVDLMVTWPDGAVQNFPTLSPGIYHEIRRNED